MTTRLQSISRIGVVAAMVGFVGCSTLGGGGTVKKHFTTSRTLPAAQGTVAVNTTENRNTGVEIQVNHLTEPGRVVSGASTYVVWAQPSAADGMPQNLGALRVNDDLSGRLATIVPYTDFRVFVTAEPSANVTSPSGEQLLWTQVMRSAE